MEFSLLIQNYTWLSWSPPLDFISALESFVVNWGHVSFLGATVAIRSVIWLCSEFKILSTWVELVCLLCDSNCSWIDLTIASTFSSFLNEISSVFLDLWIKSITSLLNILSSFPTSWCIGQEQEYAQSSSFSVGCPNAAPRFRKTKQQRTKTLVVVLPRERYQQKCPL